MTTTRIAGHHLEPAGYPENPERLLRAECATPQSHWRRDDDSGARIQGSNALGGGYGAGD